MSPLWRPAQAVDGIDKADASPTPPTAEQNQKSGHSMCDINRTTSEARYRLERDGLIERRRGGIMLLKPSELLAPSKGLFLPLEGCALPGHREERAPCGRHLF